MESKEKPILMNTFSVQAILEDKKSMTRRVIKPQPINYLLWSEGFKIWIDNQSTNFYSMIKRKCPYGKVGDILWVKETFGTVIFPGGESFLARRKIVYKADGKNNWRLDKGKWTSPRYMPKKYSRIKLEVIDVKVEKVQDISEDDCMKEGIDMETKHGDLCINIQDSGYSNSLVMGSAVKTVFKNSWNSINEKKGYGWDKNNYVWVILFKHISKN